MTKRKTTARPPKKSPSTRARSASSGPPMDVDPSWLETGTSSKLRPPPLPGDGAGGAAARAEVSPRGTRRPARPSKRPTRASKRPMPQALLPEDRVAELGLDLPPAPEALATYVTCVRHGNTLHLAGHGPVRGDGTSLIGCIGEDLDLEAGIEGARLAGLATLATLRDRLGSLDRVARFLRIVVYVRAAADFLHHPKVANGFSDLMEQVFGAGGLAARTVVGVSSLPAGMVVAVEATVEIDGGE